MKQVVLILALCAIAASAEIFSGTVVDVTCKDNELTTHPRRCAISCARHGFGLKEADGTFLKFDAHGNELALSALKRSTKMQNLKANITGTVKDGVLKIESIAIH